MNPPRSLNLLDAAVLDRIANEMDPGARVVAHGLRPLETNVALTSHVYKLDLHYVCAGEQKSASFVVKCASDAGKEVFGYLKFYETEMYAYAEVLPRQRILPYPKCHFKHYDRSTGDFIMVLQDLSGCGSGNQFRGCDRRTAADVLDKLARFHRHWFDVHAPHREAMKGWTKEHIAFHHREFEKNWEIALNRFGSYMPRSFVGKFDALHGKYPEIWREIGQGPQTIIHFDLRLDNLVFDGNGRLAAVLDWQLSRIGNPAYDVSLFVVGNLADGGGYGDLLEIYCESLGMKRRDDSRHRFFNDFRKSLLCHFCREIGYLGEEEYDAEQRAEYAGAVFTRYARALEEFDVASFLK